MFKNLSGRIRDWWKKPAASETDHKPQFSPKAHPGEQLERESEPVHFLTRRTRWATLGLNRKERRARFAQLKKLVAYHYDTKLRMMVPSKRKDGTLIALDPMKQLGVNVTQWELKNTPRNIPSNGGSNNPIFEGRI